MEHGLARIDEGVERITFVVAVALLVDGIVEVPHQRGHLLNIVLQRRGEPALMRFCCQHSVVGDLLCAGQRESAVVGIAVHVIELDAIEALGAAQVEPRLHDWAEDADCPDVQPTLPRPAIAVPLHARWELPSVRTPVLPASRAHVADHALALAVQRHYHPSTHVKQVYVEHLGVD